MKKIIISLLLLLTLIPLKVSAAAIKDTTISGMEEKTIGEELSLSFNISFSGIQKGNSESLGILLVAFELIYDDTVFVVTDVSSIEFDSSIYKEDGKYYVIGQVNENNAAKNKCIDGILFCADYLVSITFYVKDTNKTSSIIKMGEIEVGLLPMLDENSEYTEEDVVFISGISNKSKTIKINKTQTTIQKEPENIVDNSKPKLNEKVTPPKKNDNVKKSDNNYLTSIQIENYKIEFDKKKNNYDITIEKEINKLDIKVNPENNKSTYTISGADNLEKNKYKIIIEVIAENGDKNTYTINVKIKEDNSNVEKNNNLDKIDKEKTNFKLSKKHIIFGGVMLFLIFIVIVILKIKDRKIDKALDKL